MANTTQVSLRDQSSHSTNQIVAMMTAQHELSSWWFNYGVIVPSLSRIAPTTFPANNSYYYYYYDCLSEKDKLACLVSSTIDSSVYRHSRIDFWHTTSIRYY